MVRGARHSWTVVRFRLLGCIARELLLCTVRSFNTKIHTLRVHYLYLQGESIRFPPGRLFDVHGPESLPRAPKARDFGAFSSILLGKRASLCPGCQDSVPAHRLSSPCFESRRRLSRQSGLRLHHPCLDPIFRCLPFPGRLPCLRCGPSVGPSPGAASAGRKFPKDGCHSQRAAGRYPRAGERSTVLGSFPASPDRLLPVLQMRQLERVGLHRDQAEALTRHLTELLCLHKQRITERFVEKEFVQRAILETEGR